MLKSVIAVLMFVLIVSSATIGRRSDDNNDHGGSGGPRPGGPGGPGGPRPPPPPPQQCPGPCPPPPSLPCGVNDTLTHPNSALFTLLFAILNTVDCSQFSPLLTTATLEANVATLKTSYTLLDNVQLIDSTGTVLADTANPNPTANFNTRLSVMRAHQIKSCKYGWESRYVRTASANSLYVTMRCETSGYGFLTGAPVLRLTHSLA